MKPADHWYQFPSVWLTGIGSGVLVGALLLWRSLTPDQRRELIRGFLAPDDENGAPFGFSEIS